MSTSYGWTGEELLKADSIPVVMTPGIHKAGVVTQIWNGIGWLYTTNRAGYAWYARCQRAGLGFTAYPEPPHQLQAPMVGLVEGLMPKGWS